MCGVCAGNPKDVTLGDVIIAEVAYRYTEGKQTEHGFEADIRPEPLDQIWLRAAQDFSTVELPSFNVIDNYEREVWLLERLLEGDNPTHHPARRRYFDNATWRATLTATWAASSKCP